MVPHRTVLLVLMASAAFGQSTAAAPAFEVASIRPSDPEEQGGRVQFLPGGRFTVNNAQLIFIIQQVYGLQDYQVAGAPKWISDWSTSRFDIQAKAGASTSEAELRRMAQNLLADRFNLKTHRETRSLPVYELAAAPKGLRLQATQVKDKPPGAGGIEFAAAGWIRGTNIAMPALIRVLTTLGERPVLDRTGFAGAFDFSLEWAADPPAGGRVEAGAQEPRRPSLLAALQEQLGLKLAPGKAPVEVLVIDSVEKPTAN